MRQLVFLKLESLVIGNRESLGTGKPMSDAPPTRAIELARLLHDAGASVVAVPDDGSYFVEVCRPDCVVGALHMASLPRSRRRHGGGDRHQRSAPVLLRSASPTPAPLDTRRDRRTERGGTPATVRGALVARDRTAHDGGPARSHSAEVLGRGRGGASGLPGSLLRLASRRGPRAPVGRDLLGSVSAPQPLWLGGSAAHRWDCAQRLSRSKPSRVFFREQRRDCRSRERSDSGSVGRSARLVREQVRIAGTVVPFPLIDSFSMIAPGGSKASPA